MSIVKYIDGTECKNQLYINLLRMITDCLNTGDESLLSESIRELRDFLIGSERCRGIIVISAINDYSKFLISSLTREYKYILLDEANQEYIAGYDALVWCGGNGDILLRWGELSKLDNFIDMQLVLSHTFLNIPSAYYSDMENERILNKLKPQCLITGMSYIRNSISTKHLNISSVNAASSSSDLYYDYLTYKDVCSKTEGISKLIIGLAPYSLRYDLSLVKREYERSRLHYLYSKFSDAHNCTDMNSLEAYARYKSRFISLFSTDFLEMIFTITCNKNRIMNLTRINTTFDPNSIAPAEIQLMRGKYNKPYPATVVENKKILLSYIDSALEKKHRCVPLYSTIFQLV